MGRSVRPIPNARTLPFPLENDAIADCLIEEAQLLESREANPFRVQRYPRPAEKKTEGMPQPSVSDLLSIDEEYRRKARLGRLIQIAPARFNPDKKLWLPILRTRRNGHLYTALFSNSPLAHELGTTHDWVVIYHKGDDRQWTVVTARRGSTDARRIVRGRESECDTYYAGLAPPP